MCNLYSVTNGQQAIRELANAMRDTTGNLPPMPGVFPDYPAPIVRTAPDGVRELVKARWGMPSPAFALQGRANADVGAIHPKAMPVILRSEAEVETWLTAPWVDAATLQRPLPDGALAVVARGAKQDAADEFAAAV